MDPRHAGKYAGNPAPGPRPTGQYAAHPSGKYADQSMGWGSPPSGSAQALPQSTGAAYAPQTGHDANSGYHSQAMPSYHPQGGQYAPSYPTGGYAPGYEAGYPTQAPPPYGAPGMGAPMMGQRPFGGPSFFSNPFSMFTTVANMGQNMQASQQYVQNKVTWFTGGLFQKTFHVDPPYVKKKLVLLLAPFLRSYDYIRTPESVGGQVGMKAPRYDLYAPDLYIPLVSMLTYVVMVAATKFMSGDFKPELMYNTFSWASTAWALNFCALWACTKAMGLAQPPTSLEMTALTGYAYVYYCVSMLVGWLLGRGLAWHSAWIYTSFCMASFLVRTFKQIIRMDPACRGVGAGKSVMYLLLMMGLMQCALAWVMGATVHSPAAKIAKVAATQSASAAVTG